MILKTAFAALFALAAPSFAQAVEVACYWDEPVRYLGGTATELETLYGSAAAPAYFSIDAGAETVSHSDPNNAQAAVFPKLSLKVTRDSVRIIAPSPTVKDLQSPQSVVEIKIDRYTLESSMLLGVPSSVRDVMSAQWKRSGRCNARRL